MPAKMYSIRDVKAELFGKPFLFVNEAMATRAFMHAVSGADNSMSDYPDDFVLYYLGEWDDHAGLIKSNDPVRVISGLEVLHLSRQKAALIGDLQKQIDLIENGDDEDAQ